MQNIINQINTCIGSETQRNSLLNLILHSEKGDKVPKLYVLFGKGNNGKSTLVNLVKSYLGDCCTVISACNGIKLQNHNLVIINESNKTLSEIFINKLLTNTNCLIMANSLEIIKELPKDMYEIITFDKTF